MTVLDAQVAAAWLADYAAVIADNVDLLTDLDRQIGDADHGSNMHRGMKAVAALGADDFADAKSLLKKAGMTLVNTVGGASGPLYGTFFLRLARELPDDGDITAEQWGAALRAGLVGIVERGKASVGDKTMVDALTPAVDAFESAAAGGADVAAALAAAAQACADGRDGTVPLIARKGRASYLGERSRGVQDPGATSATLLVESAARTLG